MTRNRDYAWFPFCSRFAHELNSHKTWQPQLQRAEKNHVNETNHGRHYFIMADWHDDSGDY